MPIDQLANYAEIFGGIAVVVSLIYVGLQLRANTKEQRQQRRVEIFEIENSIHDFMVGPGEIAETFVSTATDLENASMADRIRFSSMFLKVFNAYEMLISMYEDGTIPKERLDRFERFIAGSFVFPNVRLWWLTTPYRDYVSERVLKRNDEMAKAAAGVEYVDPDRSALHAD